MMEGCDLGSSGDSSGELSPFDRGLPSCMPSSVVVIAVVEDGETPQATLHNLDNMSAATRV
jgi:hypothetical protein